MNFVTFSAEELQTQARKVWVAHSVHACLSENSDRVQHKGGSHTKYNSNITRTTLICICCAEDKLDFSVNKDFAEDELFGQYLPDPNKMEVAA